MSSCPKCGWWKRFCHCGELNIPYTSKDRMWNFFSDSLGIKIESKQQWKREMKLRGCHDDVKIRKPDEIRASFNKNRFTPTPREEIKKEIWRELKDKGLNDKLVRRK
jgi:hypothetical protein